MQGKPLMEDLKKMWTVSMNDHEYAFGYNELFTDKKKFAGARKNDISKTFAIQQDTAVN